MYLLPQIGVKYHENNDPRSPFPQEKKSCTGREQEQQRGLIPPFGENKEQEWNFLSLLYKIICCCLGKVGINSLRQGQAVVWVCWSHPAFT